MLTRKRFIVCTLLVAFCGLTASAILGWNLHINQQRKLSAAAWKEKYKSAAEMVSRVDAIVLARATAINPGRVAYSANGEDALPFEVVEFSVISGLKGAADGAQVSVERVGGSDNNGHSIYFGDDGGPVEVGNTYLLFLKRQEDGPYYYQVNNQGRFRVAGGRLQAADPEDKVAASLDKRSVAEGIEIVKRNVGRKDK